MFIHCVREKFNKRKRHTMENHRAQINSISPQILRYSLICKHSTYFCFTGYSLLAQNLGRTVENTGKKERKMKDMINK